MMNVLSLARKMMGTGAGQVIINRLTVMVSGLGIALLAPALLAPTEQGYFFTFMSLASLQGLFELGITALLVQHFAHLQGRLSGAAPGTRDEAIVRVGEIFAYAQAYFNKAGLLFIALVGCGGAAFFTYSQGTDSVVIWLGPWLIMVLATAIALRNLAALCAIEGFGSLQKAYQIRTRCLALMFVVFAAGVLLSAELYAHPVALLAAQVYSAVALKKEFASLGVKRHAPAHGTATGLPDLRANQRKFAVSAIAGFVTASSITPYAFHFFGPVIAGQVGLSTAMFMAAASLAMAFSTADAPVYGQLLSQGKSGDVLRAWRKNVSYSLVFAFTLSGILVAVNIVLTSFFPAYASKVLGLAAFLFLGIMVVANTSLSTVSTVLRAFKTEVLMWPSVLAAIVSLVLQFGLHVEPEHYFLGMAMYNGLIFLPYAFYLMMQRLDLRPAVLAAK